MFSSTALGAPLNRNVRHQKTRQDTQPAALAETVMRDV